MSLITSCPACGTMFRVVPDQLKISEGWVRCGHCAEVFDATAFLTDESALELVRGEEPTRPADLPTTPAALTSRPRELPTRPGEPGTWPADLPTAPADLPAGRREFAAGPATVPAELPTRPAELPTRPAELRAARAGPRSRAPEYPDSSSFEVDSHLEPSPHDSRLDLPPHDSHLEPSPLDSPFVFRASDMVAGDDFAVQPPAPRDSQLPREEHEPATADDLHDVSFVRQARRRAFWRRPAVRVMLAFASLALAALLVLQFAWQDRDRLALAEPALRPALQRMCELLGCTLGPPRQIEAIVIESSGFNRLRNDSYRLAFTLRNTSRVPVAVPAVELTITDAQDQPIARRVLLQEELAAAGAVIPPAGDWSRSLGLSVSAPGTSRVAGYRLLAFYP